MADISYRVKQTHLNIISLSSIVCYKNHSILLKQKKGLATRHSISKEVRFVCGIV